MEFRFKPNHSLGEDFVSIEINPQKLFPYWVNSDPFFIDELEKGWVEQFERFLATGKEIEMPVVGFVNGVFGFHDGRHRFLYFVKKGFNSLPVMIKRGKVDLLEVFR